MEISVLSHKKTVNKNINDVNESFFNSIDDSNMFYVRPHKKKFNSFALS